MRNAEHGWTDLLRRQGSGYLSWLDANDFLETKFKSLATGLWTLLRDSVCTPEEACRVWEAIPAVLSHCNEQATYEMPGAAIAYAWLHLLDRYARTWRALEILIETFCLPMGKRGVSTLDIGTGPGPSAFAVYDFYASMMEYAAQTGNLRWRQPPHVTCVELDSSTNHLRHCLAEIVHQQSLQTAHGVLDMCAAIQDFRSVMPSTHRKRLRRALRWVEDTYYDEMSGEWVSDLRYSSDQANDIAQSQHRYRLFTFSNFLTTPRVITCFESNLSDILEDAQPGSVVMVLGGRRGPYPDVYKYVDQLTTQAGFELAISDRAVSSADTSVADQVYEEGVKVYGYLQSLLQDAVEETEETQMVRRHFAGSRTSAPSSELRAYRKY